MKITSSRHLRTYSVVLLSSFVLCGSSQAATISIGDSVTGEFGVTSGSVLVPSASATVVDPGIEFQFGGNRVTLDLREDAFDITYNLTGFLDVGDLTTWSLTGLSDIQGVSLTSGNPASIADLSFTVDSITVDFINLQNPPPIHAFSFAVVGSPPEPPSNAIPEPSGILTLGFLLGGGAFIRRRRV